MARRKRGPGQGRPLLLRDEKIRKAVIDTVSAGVPLHYAATYAGVSRGTLLGWLAKGRAAQERADATDGTIDDDDRLYVDFLNEVEQARSRVMVRSIAQVQKAAQGGYVKSVRTYVDDNGRTVEEKTYADVEWKAATWLLERSFRNEFGRSQFIELSPAGMPLGMESSEGKPAIGTVADGEAVQALAERLASAAARQRAIGSGSEEPVDAEVVED